MSPFPELAHGIAVLAVPLHPAQREIADLIAALAEIPGLGDQFHRRQRRVLINGVEERAQLIDVLEFSRERRREIEAKPVHVHLGDPVAQAVHEDLQWNAGAPC
jgi:hypothetical protein